MVIKIDKDICRCFWANPKNPLYIAYHDEEWGVPCHDDSRLFEMLILEGFQAGLSWECVLYSYLQAIGVIDGHLDGCWKYRRLK